MTCIVSSGALNSTHSLSCSVMSLSDVIRKFASFSVKFMEDVARVVKDALEQYIISDSVSSAEVDINFSEAELGPQRLEYLSGEWSP